MVDEEVSVSFAAVEGHPATGKTGYILVLLAQQNGLCHIFFELLGIPDNKLRKRTEIVSENSDLQAGFLIPAEQICFNYASGMRLTFDRPGLRVCYFEAVLMITIRMLIGIAEQTQAKAAQKPKNAVQ